MNRPTNPSPFLPSSRPLRIDVIGALGHNSDKRVLPALRLFANALDVVGYDLADGPSAAHGFPVVRVWDPTDLLAQLRKRRADIVWIETPDDAHLAHIRLALKAGARLVLCEKCIALDAAQGAEVLDLCRQAEPHQQVRFIDHYLLLPHVLTLLANTAAWLGRPQHLRVTLLESHGVSPQQERSHRNGMTDFVHHVVALAGLWFDVGELTPTEAAWARHHDARVPDTYRAARFASTRTGAAILEGAVGKYMNPPVREIRLLGTHGQARIDRSTGELHVVRNNGRAFVLPGADADSGYASLAGALADGTPLPPLLTPAGALQVLAAVEAAQAMARLIPAYGNRDRARQPFTCAEEMTVNQPAAT